MNGSVITNLFNPLPGMFELVNVPVVSGKNVVELKIDGPMPNRTATDTDRLVIQVP